MEKKATGVVSPGRVKIPYDLLKKFQEENKGSLEFHIDPAPGILMFPESILVNLGYGDLVKAGFDVVIVPRQK
jgi:hypothetical protein